MISHHSQHNSDYLSVLQENMDLMPKTEADGSKQRVCVRFLPPLYGV